MTFSEYNAIVESLKFGHDLEFNYKCNKYFIEHKNSNVYAIYNITNENNEFLLNMVTAENVNELLSSLLTKTLFEGKSFNDIYPYVDDYYVE